MMSPIRITKAIIVAAIVGYLSFGESEARALSQQEATALAAAASNINNDQNALRMLAEREKLNLDQADSEDDDDEDDKSNVQLQNPLITSGTDIYQEKNRPYLTDQSFPNTYQAVPTTDLQTQASHHHHGHGAKGWLDMGAWTGKKGSFGWYDKHPVGKGK